PEERSQTARDLVADLNWLSEDSGATTWRPLAMKRQRRTLVVAAGLGILAVAAGSYVLSRRRTMPATTLEALSVVQLTTSANAERPAISPDGKYVAYIQRDGDAYSLWIRQTN